MLLHPSGNCYHRYCRCQPLAGLGLGPRLGPRLGLGLGLGLDWPGLGTHTPRTDSAAPGRGAQVSVFFGWHCGHVWGGGARRGTAAEGQGVWQGGDECAGSALAVP